MKNQKKDLNNRLRELRLMNKITGDIFDIHKELIREFMKFSGISVVMCGVDFSRGSVTESKNEIQDYKEQLEAALKKEDYQEAARLDKLLKQANEAK